MGGVRLDQLLQLIGGRHGGRGSGRMNDVGEPASKAEINE